MQINYKAHLRQALSLLFSFVSLTPIVSLKKKYAHSISLFKQVHILAPGASLVNYSSNDPHIFGQDLSCPSQSLNVIYTFGNLPYIIF